MKKIVFLFIPLIVALGIFLVFTFFFNRVSGKGALQVTTTPKSKVFLNGNQVGVTPLCLCEANQMVNVGEYTLKVVPEMGNLDPFEEKITISKSILTVVDRVFGPGATSEGSVITLSPLDADAVEVLVLSLPDKANVFMDSSAVGFTPLLLKNITASDHEIKLTKEGFRDKIIRIRTVSGYKLSATVYLGVGANTPTPSPSSSPSATPKPAQVTILQTPTGFLRVRAEASIGAAEVGRVNPGETYELVSEQGEWYSIRLSNGTVGWISSQYAQK